MAMESSWRLIFMTLLLLSILTLLIRLYNSLVQHPRSLRALLSKDLPQLFFLVTFPRSGELKLIPRRKRNKNWQPQRPTAAPQRCFPSWKNGEDNMVCILLGVLIHFNAIFDQQCVSGDVFLFALGNTQILCILQPDLVKEIATCKSLDFGKPSYQHKDRGPLLGQGILTSNGSTWAHQRNILAPEFYMDKVKGMMSLIIESANWVIESWRIAADVGLSDLKIDEYMRSFSGDVISRACFGSSYAKGEQIFLKLRALQAAMSEKGLSTGIPGMRHVPTKSNMEAWALEREIRSLILQVAEERRQCRHEKDLLQMVLEGAQNGELSHKEMDQFIVDNCKNIYLAGFETTAVSATWSLMLLASDQQWQARVRAEVLDAFDGRVPDFAALRKLKQVTMVIQESMRLYPPVPVVSREALKEIRFGNLTVPKNVNLWTVIPLLHTDPDVWGPDAYEFKPSRFANGIAGACKYPHFYMPFGVGPRVCVGQNLAMVELKVLISLLVSNFSFSLSPNYVHSPALRLVIEPEHDVQLLMKKL